MIIIFTGEGKGKTTTAVGTALRAVERNKKVLIIQFFKSPKFIKSGEIEFLKKLNFDNIQISSFGMKRWLNPKKINNEDHGCFKSGLNKFYKGLINFKPFLVILDEILIALKFGITNEDEIIKLFDKCNKLNIHLIITGRGATEKLIAKADLVTEMKKIKHPYDRGTKAIEGLDY